MASRAAAVIISASCAAATGPLDYFLTPISGFYAANADMVPPSQVSTVEDCALLCLEATNCVSFNACQNANGFDCGIQSYSMGYRPAAAAQCSLYTRVQPRNDTRVDQAVPWVATAPPPGSVTLGPGGIIADAFAQHHDQYLAVRSPDDMLYWFRDRSGQPQPNGSQCFGWDGWIKGSATGNFLMGSGSYLQWASDAKLAANVQAVVDGIGASQDPRTGWLWAFNESDIDADNLPDYCAGWVTRGLLDAHVGGADNALNLNRQQISLFNNHSRLAWFLPQNGGPNPTPERPSGFNNVTVGGYGQDRGHMIYIEYQGMIKHSLMALSEAGTQADIDILENLYLEKWWIDALLRNDTFNAIWHRTFFSHNYEVTAYESILDLYVLTGNASYFQAMKNAWSLLREQWILPGGSFALNEGSYYPPGSYYIGFTGINVASAHDHHHHGGGGEVDADGYFHSKCMFQPEPGPVSAAAEYKSPLQQLRANAMLPAPPAADVSGPNDNDPPTGELCGNVFWAFFNKRFHQLGPAEVYAAEIERSIVNVALAALGTVGSGGEGPNGTGIRYFANQHKQKQNPSMHASCCEGQGTRLFGSLPKFLYTLAGAAGATNAVYVDVYATSTLAFGVAGGQATLSVATQWPYDAGVSLTLTLPAATSGLAVALRIPAWTAAPSVTVTVGGAPYPEAGAPGSYLHVAPAAGWPAGATTISFSLPMAWAPAAYTGSSQLPPYARASFLLGPVLMSFEGPWDSASDSLVMPAGLDWRAPQSWLLSAGDGNALHFVVAGTNGEAKIIAKPYFEVQEAGERFTNYPCFH